MGDQNLFLRECEEFLTETNMSASYFGKASVGNSEMISRLRAGGRVWPETMQKARQFMAKRRAGPLEAAE